MFWPLQLSSEILGISEDSQVPISGVWVSSSLLQSEVVTILLNTQVVQVRCSSKHVASLCTYKLSSVVGINILYEFQLSCVFQCVSMALTL
jgi:hypothetical protein